MFLLGEIGAVAEALKRVEAWPGIEDNAAARHAMRAEVLKRAGRFAEALGEVDQALELDPLSPRLIAERAVIYAELGETELARRDYECALELSDDIFLSLEIQEWLQRLDVDG